MPTNVPNEYLITIGDDSWMAKYVGSGAGYQNELGFSPAEATERYRVPEGTLLVSAEKGACQLVTRDPELPHFYRMRRF